MHYRRIFEIEINPPFDEALSHGNPEVADADVAFTVLSQGFPRGRINEGYDGCGLVLMFRAHLHPIDSRRGRRSRSLLSLTGI
jgi:hypothetical protein